MKYLEGRIRAIKRHHQAAQDRTLEAVQAILSCGRELLIAREDAAHGDWEPFLESCGLNRTTAWRYMKVAQDYSDRDAQLMRGNNLCDLYRELGLMKPLEGGGNRLGKDELDRRREEKARQFQFGFMETALGEIRRFRETNRANPFTLLPADQLADTVEELEEALELAKEAQG